MRRMLIVPAAGLGSRLGMPMPKALVPVNGRPMLDHLFELCAPYVQSAAVIAHPSFSDAITAHVNHRWSDRLPVRVFEQPSPTGMLDAILLASAAVDADRPDAVWIVWCDQVGLLPATLENLARATRTPDGPALAFPTVWRVDPYIHFARTNDGRIEAVLHRREGDRMPEAGESDMGIFALSRDAYQQLLPQFAGEAPRGHGTGERNFLPFIPWLARHHRVLTIPCTDPHEAIGVNTPEELRVVEQWLRTRVGPS